MGMRSSDATFLRREIVPVLERLGAVVPDAAVALGELLERIPSADDSDGFEPRSLFELVHECGTGDGGEVLSWHVNLSVDGYAVPYVTGTWVEQGDLADHVSLILDRRFGISTSVDELARWASFLAHAMAVAAGRTSHGPNSFVRNPHGRTGGGETPPGGRVDD